MTTRRSKKFATVSARRWFAYAAAGVATATAGTISAEAEVHYSGPVHLPINTHRTLPLSSGASIRFFRSSSFAGEFDLIGVTHANHGGIRADRSNHYHVAALLPRQNISRGPFYGGSAALVSISGSGNFADKGVHFAGFKFDVSKGVQYGWVRINTVVGGSDNKLAVLDYAWADPGESIKAGQKSAASEADVDMASLGSLGLLALGATGLLAWRRERGAEH